MTDRPSRRPRRWLIAGLLLVLALLLFRAPGRAIAAGILAAGRQMPQIAAAAAGLFTLGRLLLLLLAVALIIGLLRRSDDGP